MRGDKSIRMAGIVTGCCALTLLLPGPSRAAPPIRQACNVDVDVTDTDPQGTHVRAMPGGRVIASLSNPRSDGWVAVHLSAQLGDWYEIDRASLIAADLPVEGTPLFRGHGYVHKSVVGVSGLENGSAIYADHDVKSRPVDRHAAGDQQVDLLGCWGTFLKVHVRKGTGWTKDACTNMDTTCS